MDSRGVGAGQMGNSLPAVQLPAERSAVVRLSPKHHSNRPIVPLLPRGQRSLIPGTNPGPYPKPLNPTLHPAPCTLQALALGYVHTCALLDDATVACWGGNYNGQLGVGDTDDRGDEEVTALGLGVSI